MQQQSKGEKGELGLDVNIKDGIRSFAKTHSDVIYYPIDLPTVTKLATRCFECLPYVSQYKDIPFDYILKLIKANNFISIFKDEVYTRGDVNVKSMDIYVNYEKGVFLVFFFGDELEDIDYSGYPNEADAILDRLTSNNGSNSQDGDYLGKLMIWCHPVTYKTSWFKAFAKKLNEGLNLDLKVKITKNSVNFLCYNGYFRLNNVKLNNIVNVDLELNYGPEFLMVHDKLTNFLRSDETGLVILHGLSGTGKTSYIKHLLSTHLNKKVVYVPPNLISRVCEPEFLSFMLSQSDFILVIEDAEEIVTARTDTQNASGVSNLLNLSDGILGDCIKCKVLVTFNTQITNIDPALTRKGRLRLEYEFGKLSVELATKLFRHLNMDYTPTEPMSLGDIYNFRSSNLHKEKAKGPIGFSV